MKISAFCFLLSAFCLFTACSDRNSLLNNELEEHEQYEFHNTSSLQNCSLPDSLQSSKNEEFAKLIYEYHVDDSLPSNVSPNWNIAYRIQSDTNNLMFLHIIPSYDDSSQLKYITIIDQKSLSYDGLVLDADFEDSTEVYNYLVDIGFTEIYQEYAALIGEYYDLGNCAQQNFIAQVRCPDPPCGGMFPKAGDSWLGSIWKDITNWFEGGSGSSGGGGSPGDGGGTSGDGGGIPGDGGIYIFSSNSSGSSGSSGGGGGGTSPDPAFSHCTKRNIETFQDIDIAIQKIDLFISNYLLIQTATTVIELLNFVKEDCLNESDFNTCLIQSIGCDLLRDGEPFENSQSTPQTLGQSWLECQGSNDFNDCIWKRSSAYTFLDRYNFEMSVDELLALVNALENQLGVNANYYSQNDFNEFAIDAIFINDLNSHQQFTDAAIQERNDSYQDKVYFDYYGYGGLLQWYDAGGYWIYERPDRVEPNITHHFKYINNSWIPYDPPVVANIHFLDAMFGYLVDNVHTILDVIGYVPLLGEPADGLNAFIYFLEGDYVNGALSAVAVVPFYGIIPSGLKFAKNTLKLVPDVGSNIFVSNKGLEYFNRSYNYFGVESSLSHVLRHTKDVTHYPDGTLKAKHGVFDDNNDVVGIIDEAYQEVIDKTNRVVSETRLSDRVIYKIDMERRIGWEGGYYGDQGPINHIKITVFKEAGTIETKKIITAFPEKH